MYFSLVMALWQPAALAAEGGTAVAVLTIGAQMLMARMHKHPLAPTGSARRLLMRTIPATLTEW